MKTPEDIIQETIDMIDEYEAKIDEISKRGRKFDNILWLLIFPIVLVTIVIIVFVLLL